MPQQPIAPPLAPRNAYPTQLTDVVLARWDVVRRAAGRDLPRPARQHLDDALSICYQASLLREEDRPVTFRVALADPDTYDATGGPPSGLHRLVFDRSRPLDEQELRRLSPAAAFSRSFIGATFGGQDGLQVWGLVHSGPQWLQSVRGGRETRQAMPPVLTVAVTGPGRVVVRVGMEVIAELGRGTLVGGRLDVFAARWMEALVRDFGTRIVEAQARLAARPDAVDPAFAPTLGRHVLRRILATIRSSQHGGTVLLLPVGRVDALLQHDGLVRAKYVFDADEPRRRISTLARQIVDGLLADRSRDEVRGAIGWSDYEASEAATIVEHDEALFEVAHLVADLSQVDGAVVMTDQLDLIGFGGEITGRLPEVTRVAHAVDLEGDRRTWVRTDRVGTRHRSAYRLCQAAHDVVALVVSQDGGLQFVRWCGDAVTYWDQVATGPWEARVIRDVSQSVRLTESVLH